MLCIPSTTKANITHNGMLKCDYPTEVELNKQLMMFICINKYD